MIRILVVEAHESSSTPIESQFADGSTSGRLDVETVADVDGALSVLVDHHVDCVVCRHDPPTIDGVEVLTALRSEHPDVPVLFAAESADAVAAIDAGPTDVIKLSGGRFDRDIVTNRIASIVADSHERDKYEQIFQHANDGIIVHDPDTGEILDANRRMYEMLGYDPTRSDQLTLGHIVAGSDEYTETAARDMVQTVATEGSRTFEWLNETVEGHIFWAEVSLEPATIAGDDCVLAFVRDITDRKERERLLRDREQQFEAVFDHPATVAMVLDSDGRVVRANEPSLEAVDADPSAVQGNPLWETPFWTDDDQRRRIRDAVEAGIEGATTELEVGLGGDRMVDLRVTPLADDGTVTSVVVVGHDVTDRHRREQELIGRRERLQRLHRITADPEMAFEEQLDELLRLGAEQFGLDIGFLSRIDPDSDHFEIVAACGDHELIQAGNENLLAETYCRRTIHDDTDPPLAIQDAIDHGMREDAAYQRYGLGCYLGAEIVVDGDLYGTLCFADDDPRPQPFSEDDRTFIDFMAQWVRRELERHRYHEELAAASTRVEETIERVADAFFAVDDEWQVTYVNDAGAAVLQEAMAEDIDRDDLLGRHLWDATPAAVDTEFYDRYHEAMRTQDTVNFESYYEQLDTWYEVTAYPDADGLSVYFRDITDRKEREDELERLHDLLSRTEQIADVGGWEVDGTTMDVFWTDNLFDVLQVEYDEEPPLDDALDVYIEDDRQKVEQAVERAFEDSEPFDQEVRFRTSEGEVRWLRLVGVPVVEDGEVVTLRGTAQDITEPKRRERALSELLDVTQQFHRVTDRDELLDAIIDATDKVFGYEVSLIRLHDADAGTLPPTRLSAAGAEAVDDIPTYAEDGGIAGEAFRTGEPQVFDDLPAESGHEYGDLESAMVLPIGTHGTLGVGATEPGAFDENDAALVELLAVVAAGAFDRLDQEREMRQLQRVVEQVGEMVFLLDGRNQFTFVTADLAGFLGYDRDELRGMSLDDVMTPAALDSYEAAIERVQGSDIESATFEATLQAADGTTPPVEFDVSPTGDGDATTGVAGIVTDISELAETRSDLERERGRFRVLFEALPDPVVEVRFEDDQPLVEYVNPAFGDVFGHTLGEIEGQNLNTFLVPDASRDTARALDEQALAGERTSLEVQRDTADGVQDFLLRGITYQHDGDTYGFAVYTDLTDQKERERYLQVLNRVLRHNLRNDLTVVLSLAKRLAEGVTDDTLRGHAEMLYENVQEVAALSEKAKEIERVVGRRGEQTDAIDAVPVIEAAVEDQREAAPEARITTDVPDELWVQADDDLQRAVTELVENAIEHNPDATPDVSLTATGGTDDSEWVEFRITDDGPGIHDEEWQVVTGEEDISQLQHGSGLGLWLARWIIESYGGEIRRGNPESGETGTEVVLLLRPAPPDATSADAQSEVRSDAH